MAITEKQAELDVTKWLKSEKIGRDMCGEFDFCEKCDKNLENPCAKAYDAFEKSKKLVANTTTKPSSGKPAATKKPAKKK